MAGFEQEYKKLNREQKLAVTHPDGPLLVLAGPGTGKTQLLSMRVANILKTTDTGPENILCLTFTNKAAVNMRKRLRDLTGNDSRGVMVKTFHSFAAEIMNMYPEYFWNGARLSTAPDAAQLEIIQTILASLPLDNPLALKFAGKYTAIGDVANALKLAKEAGLTPAKLRAIIDANVAYIDGIEAKFTDILAPALNSKKVAALIESVNGLSDQPIDETIFPLLSLSTVIKESLEDAVAKDDGTGKTKHTGAWKKRWIQTVGGQRGMFDERRRNAWWLAVAEVYELYRAELHKRGYYDYADMLVEVITQLEQHPDLLASVQERFLYVLIDEFQDTNAAQLRLAHLASDHHSAAGKPNLTAVGDDDQSIYKFNGAELNNMLSFRRIYPSTELIILTKNYRSSQAILDTAKAIIEQADDRLVKRDSTLSKKLTANNSPAEKGRIQHLAFPTREHQLSLVARVIQDTYKPHASFAVLARGHESLKQMAALLLRLGVPIRYEQQSNILEHEAVRQATLLAELSAAISSGNTDQTNTLISKILRHPMWEIEPETLWELAVDNYSKGKWLGSLVNHKESRLSDIGKWLMWLSSEASYQPLGVIIEYILGLRPGPDFTSPLRDYFVGRQDASADYLHTLSAIQLLRSLVNEFSVDGEPTLEEFVRFLNLHETNEKVIADESPFVTNQNAVQLLTVHKAKGLEFDQVFIIDAVEKNWQPRAGGRKPPANLPLQPVGDDEDDYVRLMYVAATRAKHTLIVSSYYQDHASAEVLVSPIIQSAQLETIISKEDEKIPTVTVVEESLAWPRLKSANEKEMLKARLETYSLSVTHLLNFLDVTKGGPQYFLERNLLRLPEAKTASLAHGTAMHSALELAQMLTNKDRFDLEKVSAEYDKALRAQELPASETRRYIKHGQELIKRLFINYEFELPKGSLPEQNITDVSIGKAIISGKLDRIDTIATNAMAIIDYKTGKPLASFATKDQTKAIKAWKHRTQLIFYALLAQNSSRFNNIKNIQGQMIYLEADSPNEMVRTYVPSTDEINRLEKLILAVWDKIIALDLPDTSVFSPDINGIAQFEQNLIAGTI